jgi:hypothetical protein
MLHHSSSALFLCSSLFVAPEIKREKKVWLYLYHISPRSLSSLLLVLVADVHKGLRVLLLVNPVPDHAPFVLVEQDKQMLTTNMV